MVPKKSNEGGGLRFDTGKLMAWLLPAEALIELTRIFTRGAMKYSDHNWRKGMDYSKIIGPLERHWQKWKMGEVKDQETGCYHIAMVGWNALALLVYQIQGKGFDDRILPEKMTIDDNMEWIELTPSQKSANTKHNNIVYLHIDALEAKKKGKTVAPKKRAAKKEEVKELTTPTTLQGTSSSISIPESTKRDPAFDGYASDAKEERLKLEFDAREPKPVPNRPVAPEPLGGGSTGIGTALDKKTGLPF